MLFGVFEKFFECREVLSEVRLNFCILPPPQTLRIERLEIQSSISTKQLFFGDAVVGLNNATNRFAPMVERWPITNLNPSDLPTPFKEGRCSWRCFL